MDTKKLFLLISSFFLITLLFPKNSKAIDFRETFTSENSIIVKVQERIEYFFAYKVEIKVAVLEKHAEKRLAMAQVYAERRDNERVQSVIQNYLQIKERLNNLLVKSDDKDILGEVEERTIEQQKTMEEIKTNIDEGTKQEVIKVQEQVVNQIAKHVVDVNGSEGATKFLNEVVHVWAPGTGPGGGEAGVIYEGGGKLIYAPGTGPGGSGGVVIVGGEMMFAPGTSAGGSGETSVQNVIEGGGTVEGGGQNLAPGTIQGGSGGNTIDPGGVDQGDPGSAGSTEGGAPGVIDPATNVVAP